jgi:hypothetical protein
MAPNPRLFKACVLSLALLVACGASAQTPTADEEAPVASPARQEPVLRDAPAAEPRERSQSSGAAEAPSRSEPRVETPVRGPLAEPAPRITAAPEPFVERAAAAELPAKQAGKKPAAVPKKPVLPAAGAQRSANSEDATPPITQDTAAANPPSAASVVAPTVAPVPETAAIPPGAVSNPGASRTQFAGAGPVTSPTQSPVLVLEALPSKHEATVTSGLASFRYLWVLVLLLLAAGLAYIGWRVFKYSQWHLPPGF